MRLESDLKELLTAQAVHDFAAAVQMTAVAAYLDTVDRNAAARRVLTFADSARERAIACTRYLALDTRTPEVAVNTTARLAFPLPADALEMTLELNRGAQRRLRDMGTHAGDGGGPDLPGEVEGMLRELDAIVVELEIMAGCQAVQEGGERLTEPAPAS